MQHTLKPGGHPVHPILVVAYVLALLGAALFMVTGYLGGELTIHFGVGIEPGAHVNASSPFDRTAKGGKEPVVS